MISDYCGKSILVMGLGLHGGGVETVKFFARAGAKVTVTDLRPKRLLQPSLKELSKFKNVHYVLGRHRKKDFLGQNLIVKNPGVPPDSPYIRFAQKHRIPTTSDIGIFFRLCPGKIIGVTGTRGKSTTAYLIWRFLREYRHARIGRRPTRTKVFLGGNIRTSVFEILPKIQKGDWTVLELSSFQLQDLALEKKSPQIAVFTNIYRDHLNWHKNFEDYIKSKSYIFSFQNKNDYLFANPEDGIIKKVAKKAPSRVIFAKPLRNLERIVDKNLGRHYRVSVALAVAVAKRFGISIRSIFSVLKNFHGLEGRQEHIAIIHGVHFINDTTATIPEAAIAAIERFRPLAAGYKLILIAGGQDKKLDFSEFAEVIRKKSDALILLPGTATKKIKNQTAKIKNFESKVFAAVNMQQAVKIARGIAEKGDYVILSPGAASFGLFLNEFDRGEQFRKEIIKLKTVWNKP